MTELPALYDCRLQRGILLWVVSGDQSFYELSSAIPSKAELKLAEISVLFISAIGQERNLAA